MLGRTLSQSVPSFVLPRQHFSPAHLAGLFFVAFNIGDHALFSIMTTEPNAIVEPIHEKAMPVLLITPNDVEQWLRGVSVDDALKRSRHRPMRL